MKNYLLLILLISLVHFSYGQEIERQVIANATHFMENGDLSLDVTLGETVISTIDDNNDLSVGQGFHQGNLMITNAYEPFANMNFQVFPNPTIAEIFISTTAKEDLIAQVFDITGKVLIQKELNYPVDKASISLQQLPQAHYFLKITDQKRNLFFITSIQKINQ